MLLEAASAAREIGSLWDWPGWTWPGWTPIAAIASVVAVLFAALAWTQGRSSQRISDVRYHRDIQPRPRLMGTRPGTSTALRYADVSNAGGAAVTTVVLVMYEGAIYAGSGSLPAHRSRTPLVLQCRITAAIGAMTGSEQLLLAAQDVQDDWWDCLANVRIRDVKTWWKAQVDSLGIPDLSLEEAGQPLAPGWPS